ncbi:COQ9 family protein [Yoonia sp. BS5-3]|uniref:COQ9 family protein n=1 Tax=Yoonia phaeophyticola TaxID=3137369 RepID=A0ABZ2VBI1_9RHOB
MMTPPTDPQKIALLDAILPHVAFDGWSQTAFDAAVTEIGIDPAHARTMCRRGAVDLAIAYHMRADAAMIAALKASDMSDMRFRDKVAHALRLRIAGIDDKEAVRRAAALFALPHMAADGSKLIWGTADKIWEALGDTSQDVNWYTKRMTLSGVYSAVILYWLGDDSLDGQATDAFIDRRIDDVMQFEKFKSTMRDNPLFKPFTGPLSKMLSSVRAPTKMPPADLPGIWQDPR